MDGNARNGREKVVAKNGPFSLTFCQIVTRIRCKLLKEKREALVAGEGFEPSTFGL
jgi:hypothetical protein